MSAKVEPKARYATADFIDDQIDNVDHPYAKDGVMLVPLAEWERVKGFYDRIERDYPDFHRDILAAMELLK